MYIFTIIKSNVKSECMENVKHTMYKAQAHSLNRGVSLLSHLDGPFFLIAANIQIKSASSLCTALKICVT